MSITILYIAAAMAAGLLFNRFAKLISLPNVTGYLVAGLLIGPSVLNLIPKDGTECSGAQLMSKMAHNSCQSIFMHINRNSPEKFSGL